jgi:hypothetical protein
LARRKASAAWSKRQLAESSVKRLNIVMVMARQKGPKMLGCAVARRDSRLAGASVRRDAAVHRRFPRTGALPIICSAALIAAAVATAGFARAQTLADPNPPPRRSPPAVQPGTKVKPTARVKSCSAYGAGFVNLPGTDACVKIGGWVEVEGSGSH